MDIVILSRIYLAWLFICISFCFYFEEDCNILIRLALSLACGFITSVLLPFVVVSIIGIVNVLYHMVIIAFFGGL